MSTTPPVPAPAPQPPALSLPATVTAGDFLAWTVLTALPVGSTVSYLLTAVVRGAAVSIGTASVPVAADGTAAFSFASAGTALWLPGTYSWFCFAADANGNRTQLASGQIQIQPDPAGTTFYPQSRNERMLANIQALLEGKSLEDAAMYKIGGRELTKMSHTELLKVEGIYEARVRRERRQRAGRSGYQTVGITFTGDGC